MAAKNPIVQKYQELKSFLIGEKEELPDKLHEDYFKTFSSPHGQAVLGHMLIELHVFDELIDNQEAVLSNYGRRLLSHIGIVREENIKEIVKLYMNVVKRNIEQEIDSKKQGN